MSVEAPGMLCVRRVYLVKEDVGHAIPRVDCDHTVKVGLGFFKKILGRFMISSTVGILRHIKADRSSIDVKNGIVLVWKRRKIAGNGICERDQGQRSVNSTHSSISSRASV